MGPLRLHETAKFPMTIAWVFPGQGSQKQGMAKPLISLPEAEQRFARASQLMNRDLLSICTAETSPANAQEDLNETCNTQPALFVLESLLVDDLKRQGRTASLVAGHSLGELVALYAADVFDWETGLQLMLKRSKFMSKAGGGSMAAVLGFERSELENLINEIDDVVIANDNSDSQVVLSGKPEAVKQLTNQLNCKRAIQLPVSGAFHSPFMKDAAKEFEKELEKIKFQDAQIPVLSNTDPTPSKDGELLRERLKCQITSGVRWREIMQTMSNKGINTVVEIGPGNVLSNLIKRSLKDVTVSQISSASDLGY